ncbi:hypothetical protein DFH27DRAFT_617815 [Peziza echinospora]|nr:hypothetical protein DFH27DRAFT_617815 [Peziza echinospora]
MAPPGRGAVEGGIEEKRMPLLVNTQTTNGGGWIDPHLLRYNAGIPWDLRNGHDVMCVVATGQGTTMMISIFAAIFPTACVLMISPLITLMQQQVLDFEKQGLTAICITAEYLEKDPDIWTKIAAGKYQIVIFAPEVRTGRCRSQEDECIAVLFASKSFVLNPLADLGEEQKPVSTLETKFGKYREPVDRPGSLYLPPMALWTDQSALLSQAQATKTASVAARINNIDELKATFSTGWESSLLKEHGDSLVELLVDIDGEIKATTMNKANSQKYKYDATSLTDIPDRSHYISDPVLRECRHQEHLREVDRLKAIQNQIALEKAERARAADAARQLRVEAHLAKQLEKDRAQDRNDAAGMKALIETQRIRLSEAPESRDHTPHPPTQQPVANTKVPRKPRTKASSRDASQPQTPKQRATPKDPWQPKKPRVTRKKTAESSKEHVGPSAK